jgi:hypothetical protein
MLELDKVLDGDYDACNPAGVFTQILARELRGHVRAHVSEALEVERHESERSVGRSSKPDQR